LIALRPICQSFPPTFLGCHIVVTNVSAQQSKLDLLMQIPAGSLPVMNGFFTKGRFIELSAYTTQTFEFYFYFPVVSNGQECQINQSFIFTPLFLPFHLNIGR
jgi:hypothetical protein